MFLWRNVEIYPDSILVILLVRVLILLLIRSPRLLSWDSTYQENLTKLYSGTSTYFKNCPWNSCFENPSEDPDCLKYLKNHANLMNMLSFQIVGILFACCLARAIKKEYEVV